MNSAKKILKNTFIYTLIVLGVLFTSATAIYTIENVAGYHASRAELVGVCTISTSNVCTTYPDKFIGLLVLGIFVLLVDITILFKYFRQNKLVVGAFFCIRSRYSYFVTAVRPFYSSALVFISSISQRFGSYKVSYYRLL